MPVGRTALYWVGRPRVIWLAAWPEPWLTGQPEMTTPTPRFSRPLSFFYLLRLNRSAMVALLAGAAAYAAGAAAGLSLQVVLAAWLLAVGGFSLDLWADRAMDIEGPRKELRHNPLACGSLSPATGLTFSVLCLLASLALTLAIVPRALPAWLTIGVVLGGLAAHRFETPLARAVTLGLLQALYVWLGSLAGTPSLGLFLLAATFFFAMLGGRGMTDIRDFPQDLATTVQTLPKRYGVQRTANLTAVCLVIGFAFSLLAYASGEFNRTYLYLDLVFVGVGLACAWLFVARPTPRLADVLTLVFMMGTGSVICLAMILGSR